MRARDLMTREPVVVEVGRSLAEAARLMHDFDLRHLPVVEHGTLVGMLSDRDLRTYLPYADQRAGADTDAIDRLADPVTAAMQPNLLKVGPEDGLELVIDTMVEWRVGAVPVVDPGTDKLAGIISYVDVLREARGRL